jgi:hypothetical protein
MEIKPVLSAQPPAYPRREDVGAEQIKSSLPQRWVMSRAARVALGALAAMSLTGCAQIKDAATASPLASDTSFVTESPTDGQLYAGVPMLSAVRVAPLFEHGEGLGAFGCVMVSPPAFLSEDEALAVINNVAKGYGLKFSAPGTPAFGSVQQPVTNIYEPDKKEASDTLMTLTPDFADAEHGVVLEFISTQDVIRWHRETDYAISVESYDARDAAEQLSEALESAEPQPYQSVTVGVLYDPCEVAEDTEGEDWEAAEEKSRALSIEQLSAQVRDFCEWLKAQGII